MAEWFKVLVLKTSVFLQIPWVRIPFFPLSFALMFVTGCQKIGAGLATSGVVCFFI